MASCGCGCGGLRQACAAGNPPGQPSLQAGLGTHARLLRRMQARLHTQEVVAGGERRRPLRALTARSPDDLSLALLDAWAAAGDIVSFYTARVANEGYLRTATERLSVVELARAIGFEPRPGVSAETWLSLEMEDNDPSARQAWIPAGTRIRSVPGPGEASVTFETREEIGIRPEWNAPPARAYGPHPIRMGLEVLAFRGMATGLQTGDALLVVGKERMRDPASAQWDVRYVRDAVLDRDRGTTWVRLDRGLGSNVPVGEPGKDDIHVFALRQRAAVFGHNAPDWRAMPTEVKEAYGRASDPDWPDMPLRARSGSPPMPDLFLDAAHPKVLPGSWAVLAVPLAQDAPMDRRDRYVQLYQVQEAETTARTQFTLSGKSTRLRLDNDLHFGRFRNRRRDVLVLCQSEELQLAETAIEDAVEGTSLTLRGAVPDLERGRRLVVRGRRQRVRVADGRADAARDGRLLPGAEFEVVSRSPLVKGSVIVGGQKGTLEARRDQIHLVKEGVGQSVVIDREAGGLSVAIGAAAHAVAPSTKLPVVAAEPFEEDWRLLDAEGAAFDVRLPWGMLVLLPAAPEKPAPVPADGGPAKRAPEILVEAAEVAACSASAAGTVLGLAAALKNRYDPATVTVSCNVVPGTHGETVTELLAPGDASKPNQAYELQSGPLTYVSSATPRGGDPDVKVRVAEAHWTRVDSLHEAGAADPVFAVRLAEGRPPSLVFGDGEHGRRLPTGAAPLVTYRRGLGPEGNVRAGTLTLMQDRPLGLKGVHNHLPAQGGEAPATLEAARQAAPATVLTLDRAVSLADYSDLARGFGGVAKAVASALWSGEESILHVTVAPRDAQATVPEAQKARLLQVLRACGDPFQRIVVGDPRLVRFWLQAELVAADDAEAGPLQEAALAVLGKEFDPDGLDFGTPVTAARVVAALQALPGVRGVRLKALTRDYVAGEEPANAEAVPIRLAAAPADLRPDGIVGAELLVWDAASAAVGVVRR